jgi:serine/threonine protein kinase/Tol biopolymer transport system component
LTSAREQQIRALVRAALERSPDQRSSFVAELTGADEELRRSVEAMLLQQPATDVGKTTSPAQTEAAELPSGAMLGHYRIDGVLGRGGMGIVYRATDTRLGRSVAIKFLSTAVADPEVARRFQQEAKTASSLNHPHIVAVYHVGEHDGREYIVSELVDGGTLDDWSIGARGRGWKQGVELLIGVADALAAAHSAGVLHRDVKPGNILIGKNGYAKLADFGLAKLVDSATGSGKRGGSRPAHGTAAGIVVGTVAYMSPEQTAGHPLDARSDVFSFGIVLYELLAGRRPFEAANDLGVLKAIAHATPEPLPNDVPEFLQIVVEKALEKDPADRYQSMQDLVVDLRRAARKPTSSRLAAQPSDAHLFAGVVRRHPSIALAAGTVLALAVAAVTYFTVSGLRSPSLPTFREITQLTTTGTAVSPAISPDGRYVAYVQVQREGDASTSSIWIRQLATLRNQMIFAPDAGEVLAPTVTPDGTFVYFVRRLLARDSLWRVSFIGGSPEKLIDDVSSAAGLSPDGGKLAFVRTRVGQSTTLVIANADGGGERELVTIEEPTIFSNLRLTTRPDARPAWSPDGGTIALIEQDTRRSSSNVVFVDVLSGKPTIRPSGSAAWGGSLGLAWLDSKSLVLSQVKSIGQPVQLWRMSYPDGQLSPLTNDLNSYVGVDIDTARTSLVTSRAETRISLSIGGESGTGDKQIVAPVPGYRSLIGLRIAGPRVFYNASLSGRESVLAVPVSGGLSDEVVSNAYTAAPTSNGDTVVFFKSNAPGLWKLSAAARQPVVLVTEGASNPLVTPDDRYVVYLSGRSGHQAPWIVSIDGGEPLLIVDAFAAAGTVDVSPDGSHLFFVSRTEKDEPILVVCDMQTCANRRDLDVPPRIATGFRGMHWTRDGREVAYVESSGKNIWAMPVDGGEPHELTHFGDGAPDGEIVNFAWSNDGELAVARMTTSNDVVLLRLKP